MKSYFFYDLFFSPYHVVSHTELGEKSRAVVHIAHAARGARLSGRVQCTPHARCRALRRSPPTPPSSPAHTAYRTLTSDGPIQGHWPSEETERCAARRRRPECPKGACERAQHLGKSPSEARRAEGLDQTRGSGRHQPCRRHSAHTERPLPEVRGHDERVRRGASMCGRWSRRAASRVGMGAGKR